MCKMKRIILFLLLIAGNVTVTSADPIKLFEADNPYFKYIGRIDFSNKKMPRFWSPGVYIKAKFKGSSCQLLINDQELWGKNHNYLEIQIDGQEPRRIQTTGKMNVITIAENLVSGEHTVLICKNTESNIGWLEFIGLKCEDLVTNASLAAAKNRIYRQLNYLRRGQ